MTGTCTRCHRDGTLARRDLCRACYQVLWRAGLLPAAPPRPVSPPVDCTHGGRHQHGTRTAYLADGCHCEACSRANMLYEKRRTLARIRGELGPVSRAHARAHIYRLRAAGMGARTIAAAAGLSTSTVNAILYGRTDRPSDKISRATEAKILAVGARLAPHATVDATGTRRRLQALAALGYSITSLAPRLDKLPRNLWTLIGQDRVYETTRAAVALLYAELSNTLPTPSTGPEKTAVTRTRAFAKARGWAPPIAWDDDTIDDPGAAPCGLEPERPLSVAEQVLELLALGVTVTEIPGRIGRSWAQMLGAIRDPDLRADLRARAIDAGMIPAPAIVTTTRRRRDAA